MISKNNTTVMYLSQFLYALVFMIPIWIVYYQQKITVSQISFLVAFQCISQLIFELPTGALADVVGRKWTIVLSYILWSISSIFIITATGFSGIFIGVLIGGLAEAFLSGSQEALIYDSFKEDKKEDEYKKVMATNGVYFQIALAVATLSGGYLYSLWQPLPYVVYAITCFFAAIAASKFKEPYIEHAHLSLETYIHQLHRGTKEAFKNRETIQMSLFYIMVASITWINNVYLFDFILVELGFPDVLRGIIGGSMRIFNIFIIRYFLTNEKFFTKKRSLLFFPIIMIVCFLPGKLFQGWIALPFIAGTVMAGTARWIVLTKYTNELFESRYRATAISALSMIVGVFFSIITWSSGYVIEHMGGVRTMYTILGVITVFTVLPLSLRMVGQKK